MDYLSEIIKGVLIGTANILPGVSGGTLAISMGVYEQILRALTHLHKETKKSLSTLFPYILGIIGGIVGLSFTMEYLFDTWPLQTNLAFLGLIFGGLPGVLKKAFRPQPEDRSPKSFSALSAAFFATLVVTTALSLMKGSQGQDVVLETGIFPAILLFFIGVMSAGTMVVPGISGTMILMMIGYYQPLLSAINQTLLALILADFSTLLKNGIILFPFTTLFRSHPLSLCPGTDGRILPVRPADGNPVLPVRPCHLLCRPGAYGLLPHRDPGRDSRFLFYRQRRRSGDFLFCFDAFICGVAGEGVEKFIPLPSYFPGPAADILLR